MTKLLSKVALSALLASGLASGTWIAAASASSRAPGAPRITSVVAKSSAVQLSWSNGAANGAVIRSYRVFVYSSSSLKKTVNNCAASPCTIQGLSNGTRYTFKVADVNRYGVGKLSNASAAVTPQAVLTSPVISAVLVANSYTANAKTLVDVRVSAHASAHIAPAVTRIVISDGAPATCTIRGVSGSCSLTGLTSGKILKLSATAVNARGSSLASSALTFKALPGASWPYRTSNAKLALQLKSPASVHAKALIVGATTHVSAAPLRAGFQRGIWQNKAVVRAADPLSTTIAALTPDGSIVSMVQSGSDSLLSAIQQIYISPDGRALIYFESPQPIDNSEQSCWIAQINNSTGDVTCLSTLVDGFQYSNLGVEDQAAWGVNSVQFDAAGYAYLTYELPSERGNDLIMIAPDGTLTHLLPSNMCLQHWRVLPGGQVLIEGASDGFCYNVAAATNFTDVINTDGTITNLSGDQLSSVAPAGDGGALLGDGTTGYHYSPGATALDVVPWISSTVPDGSNSAVVCAAPDSGCGYAPALFAQPQQFGNSVYAIADEYAGQMVGPSMGHLMQYWPSFRSINATAVQVPLLTSKLGSSDIAIYGLGGLNGQATSCFRDPLFYFQYDNCTADHKLSIFNVATNTDTNIVLPEQIGIYYLTGSTDGSTVYFGGQVISDNSFVVGTVDVATGTVNLWSALGPNVSAFAVYPS